MPFPKNIRELVLVNSQRRCCVCRDFGGRNVNVHHIIQEADGGTNTLDNAICLCLKCHAEAGHFNSRHSLGTKYSPEELRKHRDNLWRDIENGQVLPPYEVRVAWKRTYTSQDLHIHKLIVRFQHSEESVVSDWKLHILIPSAIPVRTQNITRLNEIRIDNMLYTIYEITGGKVFPSEEVELIGIDTTWIEYEMNHDLYSSDKINRSELRWKFYSSCSASLENSISWNEMHEF